VKIRSLWAEFFIFSKPIIPMMKQKPKTLSLLLLVIAFTLSARYSFAQYPGMAAFRAQQSMQFAQRQMAMQMQMSMMMYNDRNYNPSYTFVVTMKDGSKKEFNSQILNDSVRKKNYVLFVDKNFKRSDSNRYKKIFPDQTISIARNTAGPGDVIHKNAIPPTPVYFTGNAVDSCWIFKVVTGHISAYSNFSEQQDDYTFKDFAIVGIQLNDGPIVKYNEENLKQMVGQDINALEEIQKKNYFKAIKKYNKDIEKAAKK